MKKYMNTEFDSKKVHPETLVEIMINDGQELTISSVAIIYAIDLVNSFEEISLISIDYLFGATDRN